MWLGGSVRVLTKERPTQKKAQSIGSLAYRYQHTSFGMDGVFAIGRKDSNAIVGDARPELELEFPLED